MPLPARILLFILQVSILLVACKDKDGQDQPPVVENKERIECEPRSRFCNGKDAMRFYKSTPVINIGPDSTGNVTEVWASFLICCDKFSQLMDTLAFYNDLITEAKEEERTFKRTARLDSSLSVEAGIEYFGGMQSKRWEWLNFGDSKFSWSVPTGEYFRAYKEKLEEAHARCCLL